MDAAVLYPQIGTKTDAASSTGSVHAKLAHINADIDAIAAKNIINYGTCIRSAGLYVVAAGGVAASSGVSVNISGQGIANIAKCMITLEGGGRYGSSSYYNLPFYIYSASTSSIVIKPIYGTTVVSEPECDYVSVRVLEFY